MLLLAALAFSPGKPYDVPSVGSIAVALGLLVIGWASVSLGPALTPSPEPSAQGHFTASGPYRAVRHPIYVGVIFVAFGFGLATASLPRLALASILTVFFVAKARYEERHLRARYPAYERYARTTRAFVPFVW